MFGFFRRRDRANDVASVKQNGKIVYVPVPVMDDQTANDRQLSGIYSDITPDLVRSVRSSVTSGEMTALDTIYRTMEGEWPRLKTNARKIRGKVSRLEWNVIPWAEKDAKPTPEAEQLARFVESALYMSKPAPDKWEFGFKGMIKYLAGCPDRGQGVLEIMWEKGTVIHPRSYVPITPHFYRWTSLPNEIDRLRLCPDGLGFGSELDFPENKFVIAINTEGADHPIFNSNLLPLIGWFGAVKNGLGWFMTFCQIFGVPLRSATVDGEDDVKKKVFDSLKKFGSTGILVLPTGAKIEVFDNAKSGSQLPQKDLMEMADKVCDILMIGQTLTTSTDNSGSRALGDVHKGTEDDVIMERGEYVADIINSQIIPAIVKLNYGSLPEHLPYISCKDPGSRRSKEKLEWYKGLREMEIPVAEEHFYDDMDLPIPAEGAKLLFAPRDYTDQTDEIQAAAAEHSKKKASRTSTNPNE